MEFNTKRNGKKIGINITSLIDVLFIILIFVLVSTTFLEQPALNIELPEAKTSGLQRVEELVISISNKNEVYLNEKHVKKEELENRLKEFVLTRKKDIPVILKADKKVGYGIVIEVMDLVRSVGIKKIVALTIPARETGK